jgi:hypothetical protein
MSKKRSPQTNVLRKVGECKQVISRGKPGTVRSRLSNTGMRGHLKSSHKCEYNELLAKEIEAANVSTEVEEADADETENLGVPIFNLKSHKNKPSCYGSG